MSIVKPGRTHLLVRLISIASLLSLGACALGWDDVVEIARHATDEQAAPQQQTALTDVSGACDFTAAVEGPAVDLQGQLYVPNFGRDGVFAKLDTRTPGSGFHAFKPIGTRPNGSRVYGDWLYVVDKGDADTGAGMGLKIQSLSEPDRAPIAVDIPDATYEVNDLTITPLGEIYVSAPCWSTLDCPDGDQGRIYQLNVHDIARHAASGGATVRIAAHDLILPNGLTTDATGRSLYVTTGGGMAADLDHAADLRILRFDVAADGALGEPALVLQLNQQPLPAWSEQLDGLRADLAGNLWVAHYGRGELHFIDMQHAPARVVRSIATPAGKVVTNLAFGGPGWVTLYATYSPADECGAVASAPLVIPGLP